VAHARSKAIILASLVYDCPVERINDLKLFKKILDLGHIHETLARKTNRSKTQSKENNQGEVKNVAKSKRLLRRS
jgi:hypothetical protein